MSDTYTLLKTYFSSVCCFGVSNHTSTVLVCLLQVVWFYILQTRLCACGECDEFPQTAWVRHVSNRRKRCVPHIKRALFKMHSKGIKTQLGQHSTVSILSDPFSLQTQRSSSQSCSRRCSAWSRCWSSGAILRRSLQNSVQSGSSYDVWLNRFPADRKRKYLRVPTPSRSSWRRSRWGGCPPSSSCWIRLVCQESSSLKRWVHCPAYLFIF